MKSKAAYLIKPGQFELREVELTIKSDEVLVKTAVCGLCNWELNHWKGLLGTYPRVIGHEWAGVVVEVGSDVANFKPGDKITGVAAFPGGFSEYLVANPKECVKVKDSVRIEHALGEPLKCVTTVVRATNVQAGDYGAVIGCGAMGLWCIQALAGSLATLIAVDIDDNKLALARKYGATHVINSRTQDVVKEIAEITGGRMADFVIEGTGIPAVLNTSLDYVKPSGRGKLILMSSHEEAAESFDFRKLIKKSAEIIAAHPGYALSQYDDLQRAVDYLNNGRFVMDEIISHKFTLDEMMKAFDTLENKPKDYTKGVVIF